MKSDVMKRTKYIAELTYSRAILYCRGVAKDSDELNGFINQEFSRTCYKIATGIVCYETNYNTRIPDFEVIRVADEVINYIELNTDDMSNDVVICVTELLRYGVNPSLRMVTGRTNRGLISKLREDKAKINYKEHTL